MQVVLDTLVRFHPLPTAVGIKRCLKQAPGTVVSPGKITRDSRHGYECNSAAENRAPAPPVRGGEPGFIAQRAAAHRNTPPKGFSGHSPYLGECYSSGGKW